MGRTSYFRFSTEQQARRFVYLVAFSYSRVALYRDELDVYLVDGGEHERNALFVAVAQRVRSDEYS